MGGWALGISQFFSGGCLYGWERPFRFPAGGSLTLSPVNCMSQPGRKAVPGDLSSGPVSPERVRTSGTQLTREDKTWTSLCSVAEF
ncbi:hypothetical protein ANAPC2_01201 [Anaplasma phagocytophilum]|nr:hypothetical protein ANAPC2_01201 [Anaplasma phagocytophilum]